MSLLVRERDRFMILLLVIVVCFSPIATQFQSTVTCTSNAQCFNNSFYCDVAQLCQPVSCTSSLQCANSFICSNILRCIPSVNYCALGGMCPVNFYCTGTVCLPQHCVVNVDCTRFTINAYCSPYGQCLPTICINNAQCPGNYTCNTTVSRCAPNDRLVALPTMAPPTSTTDSERLNFTVFGVVYLILVILVIVFIIVLSKYRKRSDLIENRHNNQQQSQKSVKKKPIPVNSILRVNKKTK